MPDESDSSSLKRAGPVAANGTLALDIVEDAGDWTCFADVDQLIDKAGQALAAHPRFKTLKSSEACIALSDDASVQKLNATYRAKDKPTNVLSFPAPKMGAGQQDGPQPLGDVVLALETVLREAHDLGITPEHHLQHLVVHGLLHLHGFDHETDAEADAMEALEIEILSALGVANPYTEIADTA